MIRHLYAEMIAAHLYAPYGPAAYRSLRTAGARAVPEWDDLAATS